MIIFWQKIKSKKIKRKKIDMNITIDTPQVLEVR
jgi:hypothetical protein